MVISRPQCPTCGAGIRQETFSGQVHCNGQQFEYITFQCGCIIEWVPNFESARTQIICPKDADAVALRLRKEEIIRTLLDSVKHINLTSTELTKIRRSLDY